MEACMDDSQTYERIIVMIMKRLSLVAIKGTKVENIRSALKPETSWHFSLILDPSGCNFTFFCTQSSLCFEACGVIAYYSLRKSLREDVCDLGRFEDGAFQGRNEKQALKMMPVLLRGLKKLTKSRNANYRAMKPKRGINKHRMVT